MKRLFYATVFTLLGSFAQATPDAQLRVDDTLLGANESSFLVLRRLHYFPPTYFTNYVDTQVVKLSIWTGKIQTQCLMSRLVFERDANSGAPSEKFTSYEDCTIAGMQADMQAAPPRFRNFDVNAPSLEVRDGGIWTADSGPNPNIRVLKETYILKVGGDVLGNGAGQVDPPNIYPIRDDLTAAPDRLADCKVAAHPTYIYNLAWRFLKLTCLNRDTDSANAIVYIPVSDTLWARVMTP